MQVILTGDKVEGRKEQVGTELVGPIWRNAKEKKGVETKKEKNDKNQAEAAEKRR